MTTIPTYLKIGIKQYKIKPVAGGFYSIWQCKDICSLKYLGEWTKQDIIKCYKRGELR